MLPYTISRTNHCVTTHLHGASTALPGRAKAIALPRVLCALHGSCIRVNAIFSTTRRHMGAHFRDCTQAQARNTPREHSRPKDITVCVLVMMFFAALFVEANPRQAYLCARLNQPSTTNNDKLSLLPFHTRETEHASPRQTSSSPWSSSTGATVVQKGMPVSRPGLAPVLRRACGCAAVVHHTLYNSSKK